MTYEEAKMQIQAIPEKIWDQLSEPDREAMEMAFSALQAQEAKHSSDLIKGQERCECYALCRHGRDENKLRADLGVCDYCHEDSDGYVKPIEKNGHAFIRFGMNGWELDLGAKGWHGSAKIRYCPMCGRKLKNDK